MQKELLFWKAEFTDGTSVTEAAGSFKAIMDSFYSGKLSRLAIYDSKGLVAGPLLVIEYNDRRKPIFFRRRMNHLGKSIFSWTLTAIGWEENVKGVVVKSILYFYPNGRLELSNGEPLYAQAYHQTLIDERESNP